MSLPFKQLAKIVLRPILRSWPDEGRRIVQGPVLSQMLAEVAGHRAKIRRVLNAGAGEGGYTSLLLSLPDVECVVESDIHRRTHFEVRDPRLRQIVSSLTDIPLADESIDLILCTEVLEHILDDRRALDEIRRTLSPNGWLLITVPTPPAVLDSAHVREGYRSEDLTSLLSERSLEVLSVRFCMHFFFRFVLRMWPRLAWNPRIIVVGLSYLDRILPLGPPMDLLILARRVR